MDLGLSGSLRDDTLTLLETSNTWPNFFHSSRSILTEDKWKGIQVSTQFSVMLEYL